MVCGESRKRGRTDKEQSSSDVNMDKQRSVTFDLRHGGHMKIK